MDFRKIIREVISETLSDKIVAYHGTDNEFSMFDDSHPIFFVDNPDVARTYGNKLIKAQLTISDDIKNHYEINDDLADELAYHDYEGNSGDLDGIIMKDISDAGDGVFSTHEPATNYIVFDNSQIKVLK
jgi:hypothetical protein